jgi:hypothetical protein
MFLRQIKLTIKNYSIMKKNVNLFYLVLLFVGLISLNSCKEDLPSMSCTLGGESWVSTFRITTMGEIDLGNGVGGYLITATNGTDTDLTDGEYIAILIRGTDIKEYNLTVALQDGKYQCAIVYFPQGLNVGTKYIGSSGSVSITEINDAKKKISGTFSFELKNNALDTETKSIADGKFDNLKYSEPTVALDLAIFLAGQ